MEKRRMELIIFGILILLIGIICYYQFVLSKQLADIADLKSQVEQKKELLNELMDVRKNRKSIIKQIENLDKELATLDAAIPDSSNSGEFSLGLYNYLKKQGITIKGISTQKEKQVGSYKCETISINIVGSKGKIMNFIRHLQKHERKIVISEVAFKIISTEEIDANLKINIYAMK